MGEVPTVETAAHKVPMPAVNPTATDEYRGAVVNGRGRVVRRLVIDGRRLHIVGLRVHRRVVGRAVVGSADHDARGEVDAHGGEYARFGNRRGADGRERH